MVKAGKAVALGDRYSLISGLLEITYASGPARVLEGATAYEVDSANSGFLRIGKLTLNMGAGDWGWESAPGVFPHSRAPSRALQTHGVPSELRTWMSWSELRMWTSS